MSQKTGKQVVYLYGKHIPKSGKSVFEFSGIKMCHRSVVLDKCDLLVHIDSGIIIRSYPAKTDRSIVLNDMASNLLKVNHFIHHAESYSVEERPKPQPKKDDDADVEYNISMTHYSDGSPVCTRVKEVKKYNQKDFRW